jgi:imidazolonepropionase-like amidohydrolase
VLLSLTLPPAHAGSAVVVKARHIETLAGDPIEGGAILISDGRIQAIGSDVEAPAGAEVIDLPNASVFPGMVDPFSQLGLPDSGGGQGAGAQARVADALYPFQETYEHAARAGYTTLALASRGWGIAGQAALVRARAQTIEGMLLSDRGPLVVNYRTDSPTPGAIKGALDKGGDDDKLLALKWALSGEVPLVVTCRNASDVLRVLKLLESYKQAKPVLVCTGGDLYMVAEELGKRKASVVVPAAITFRRFTRIRLNVPRMLAETGATVACIPSADNITGLAGMRGSMAELVKAGLDRDAAVRAVTSTPAKMLGLNYRLGTLEVGRDANLLILDGDLLDPKANVLRVLIEGETVYDAAWGGLK